MITKKQFCEIKIDEFCKELGIWRNQLEEDMIYSSSTLAVCMEYLGMIKDEKNKEYAAHRNGVIFISNDIENPSILSVREFINLLPQ